MFYRTARLLWAFIPIVLLSCSEDDNYIPVEEPDLISPVVFDMASVPYQTLSEYNFFEGPMADLEPVYGVLPYDLINPLFSDYAKKKRFIWMPSDLQARYTTDHSVFNFPLGTVLIKNFYYDNVLPEGRTRILETRVMINKPEGWVFANYVWNDDQSEAVFDLNGSFLPLEWEEDGMVKSVNYRIPAGPECHTCHKIGEVPIPVGLKPQNLNMILNYDDGSMNQLEKFINMGYLADELPESIRTMVAWDDESASLKDRARSYLDINCAHCHQDEAHCAYRPVRFNFDESANDTKIGVCVEPDTDLGNGLSHIISPSNHQRSVMYFRLNTNDEAVRMPLLGRTIIHQEGVDLIYDFINSLETNCQ
ncbi:MAG: hypothetical protein KJO49_03695 [Bacteroidia bacterium]|nr:hypothetical protein [Bacteroidia bacterium]MBT8270165.1 hypothetical protein [Bacteroidia bacterium]NNK68861.1 hypothetical protein [Flavobacteriaceae bacterium]NNL79628.1 hypothetical protein [Flavobacteriaceae bacterium]